MKPEDDGVDRIERRTLLKGLAAGIAGAVAPPATASADASVTTDQPAAPAQTASVAASAPSPA